MDGPASSLPELPGSSGDGRSTTPLADVERLVREHAERGSVVAGDAVGPYKLLSLLGEGGFGEVWLAERREPFVQRVAIKLIKPGMDSRAVLARFEQERQALAVMDHPNVAKVLDGGVTAAAMGSRPYFVMEHVQGESITVFCDRHTYTVKQRLELFVQVCEAVQHAHHKGIIHRDIKPSNILVTLKDEKPIPKVIDFGVAKAMSQSLTDKTIFTEQGRLIGTPEYMSPEQAEMGAVDIDTRTDVYSLGVVLYELLSGMLPFDPKSLRAAGFEAIRKMIREQDPPKPSTRLTTADDATAAGIARSRESELEALGRELRRELDWIPLKALRKDRVERYRTPSDLADDIRRYLKGEALEAGPEGAGYRVRKFVRRHRGAVAAGAAVTLALVAGLASTLWQAQEVRREAANARAAEREQRRLAGEKDLAARQADERRTIADQKTAEAEAARRSAEQESYIANLYAAAAALEAGEPVRTRSALDACPAHQRGWEWGYLNAKSDTSLLVLRGHQSGVTSASFSPDGTRIVTASKDGTARVWDAASGKELVVFRGHERPTESTTIAEGQRQITIIDEETATVSDAATGDSILTLRGRTWPVTSALLSPDGRRVITTGWDTVARIWDAASGAEVTEICDELPIRIGAFSPDGTRVVVIAGSGIGTIPNRVIVCDSGGTAEGRVLLEHDHGVSSAEFSANSTRVLTVSADQTVRVWDAVSGQVIAALHTSEVSQRQAAFSPDGRRVVTSFREEPPLPNVEPGKTPAPLPEKWAWGNSREAARVWDAATGAVICTLRGHGDSVLSCQFSPDGTRVITASADMTARVWDAENGKEVVVLEGHHDQVLTAVFAPRELGFLTTSKDGTSRVWETGAASRILRGHIGPVWSAGYSPDGWRILTASADGTARVWAGTPSDLVKIVVFGPQRQPTANLGRDAGAICLVDVARNTELGRREIPKAGLREAAVFSRDGARAVTPFRNDAALLLNLATGKDVATLHLVTNAVFSADGGRVFGWSDGSHGRIWDGVTGEQLATLRGRTPQLSSAAFSRDHKRLVTVSLDATARVWNTAKGEELLTLQHEVPATSADFSPDGDRLAIGAMDGSLRIVDVATGRELAVLRAKSPRASVATFSDDGTRLFDGGVLETIPYRIRIAERDANARGEDGGAIVKAWLREVTGGRESWAVEADPK